MQLQKDNMSIKKEFTIKSNIKIIDIIVNYIVLCNITCTFYYQGCLRVPMAGGKAPSEGTSMYMHIPPQG